MLNYYDAVADLILPHLKDRPLSLKRYPDGIGKEFFFQKNVAEKFAPWLRTEPIPSEHNGRPIHYAFAQDRASLLYLVNLGCIDQNPWMSRSPTLDNPDFVLIDLDPQECPFDRIVDAALLVKRALDRIGLAGYPKTTGGDGMHIYVPVEPVYTYEETRTFAELIARLAIAEQPELFTTPRSVAKRKNGRVYFDYLQNGISKTIAAPYVLRAYPGRAGGHAARMERSAPRPPSGPVQPRATRASGSPRKATCSRACSPSRNAWKRRWSGWRRCCAGAQCTDRAEGRVGPSLLACRRPFGRRSLVRRETPGQSPAASPKACPHMGR